MKLKRERKRGRETRAIRSVRRHFDDPLKLAVLFSLAMKKKNLENFPLISVKENGWTI